VQYSYTAESPKFGSSGNVISVYQEKDFAILQSHLPDGKPDFNPVNHWEYSLSGNFSDELFLTVRTVSDQKFLVHEGNIRSYKEDIIYERKSGGNHLYSIRYSDLTTNFSDWKVDTALSGLKTQKTTYTITVDATVLNAEGQEIDHLNGKFEHEIWITPDIPFSSIAYNILVNADAPKLFLEPENYEITNERPWLAIGKKIYEHMSNELGDKGMLVQMASDYQYTKGNGAEYQTASSKLSLKDVQETDPVSLDPTKYPIIGKELFNKVQDVARITQWKNFTVPDDGSIKLSSKELGTFTGIAFFHTTNDYFAIQAQMQNDSGDTLNFIALKLSKDLPEKGNQTLSAIPTSEIREQMNEGPPEGFMEKYFVSGVLKSQNQITYFLYPVNGTLKFKKVSENSISGSMKFPLKTVDIKDSSARQTEKTLNGKFKAVSLD
jgi:hypothetical protein